MIKKRIRQLFAIFLTLVLTVSLFQLTAFGLESAQDTANEILVTSPAPDELPLPEGTQENTSQPLLPQEEPAPALQSDPEVSAPDGSLCLASPPSPPQEESDSAAQDESDAGIALASEVSQPVSFTQDLINYTLFPDGTAEVAAGSKANKGKIHIPAIVTYKDTEYRVISIAPNAFKKSQYTTATLTLSEGLLSIGESAFAYVFLKGTVQIPNSVTSLGKKAFYECDLGMGDLTGIIIGDGLSDLPSQAFHSAWGSPTPVTLGAGIRTIAGDAFAPGTVSSLTVNAVDGSLDEVLSGLSAFSGVRVTYTKEDPSLLSSAALQELIDAAPEGQSAVIALTSNVKFKSTVVIPSGKDVTLTDDGQARTLTGGNFPMFRIEQGGRLTLATTGSDDLLTLKGGTVPGDTTSSLVTVYGTLFLQGGTLQGGTLTGSNICAALLVQNGGTLTMTGGILENTTLTRANLSAAVVVGSDSRFDMSGGVIRNNRSEVRGQYSGCGVTLYGWSKGSPSAHMTLSGDGEISGNSSAYYGGGVYLVGNVDFLMTGGRIVNNTAFAQGGGVCVSGLTGAMDEDFYEVPCCFTMDGGVISGNRVTSGNGGGIYVNSNGVELKSGIIENNTASGWGGGVYVSTVPYTLSLSNALVTGNTASVMGGGLWFCPTGSASLSVTKGAAVFGNTAAGGKDGSAGDDFAFISSKLFLDENKHVDLAGRTLGGGPVTWYQDGKIFEPKSSGAGQVDQEVPRFDPSQPGEAVTVENNGLSYALKAVISPEAQALAESQATLFIRGNSAAHGGGIGSNGAAHIGASGQEWSLRVTKLWAENVAQADRQNVTVRLKIGSALLDSLELNEENDWTAAFTGLPAPDSLRNADITVQEEVPGGFRATYGDLAVNAADRTLSITITNEKLPAPPLPFDPTTTLTVTKLWQGDREEVRPESVTVSLLRNGSVYGSAVLTAEDGWTYTWRGLSALYSWSVEETQIPENYRSEISGSGRSWTITNTYDFKEEDPPQEELPKEETPKEEELPDPDTPRSDIPAESNEELPEEEELYDPPVPLAEPPKTGDTSSLWLVMTLLSALGLIFLGFSSKKRHSR